jgi:GTP-binding protein EngB required for normal cell division
MDLLDEHAVPYQLVLTKVDALKHESEREETLAQVANVLSSLLFAFFLPPSSL